MAAGAGMAAWPWVKAGASASRPNIVFFFVDDQRNDTLGCAGHPIVRTPNVDRLAAQGVRFENTFVTTSICAASRASVFTGLTERTHGYTFGTPPIRKEDVATSYPVLLREAGYRTGFIGKFGVNVDGSLDDMFDVHKVLNRNPYFKEQPDGSKRHVSEIAGDAAAAFLQSQPDDKPFCLSVSFNAVHAEDGDKRPGIGHYPWPRAVDGLYEDVAIPPPQLSDPKYFETLPDFLKESMNRERYFWRWDTPEKYETNMRAYFRMITGVDGVIGRVLETLGTEGMAENTVVIYAADNGYYMGDRNFAGKWSHFEQSLRVPLIIYDPRLPATRPGRVAKPMALNIDVPATVLDMAGLEVPAKYQGRSLMPILRDEIPPDWRTDFFCEHHMDHKLIPKWEGVRAERYVYARYYEQQPPYEFLHDLEKDRTQLENFAEVPEYAGILEKMRARCAAFKELYPARVR
ncbi:MAG TPA: DUF4976 domain-containing protein [Candidatus Hydrogenedentes bacterium]|nr:DUF4976 domain-containing protein [Candidatus Hydrogenedentota bacterium]